MTIEEFLDSCDPAYRSMIEEIATLIDSIESDLRQGVMNVMGREMLGYSQEGEFKYAFSVHRDHLSFHNMVMYCYPEIHEQFKGDMRGVKFQKSCINFRKGSSLPLAELETLIRKCAACSYPIPMQKSRKKG